MPRSDWLEPRPLALARTLPAEVYYHARYAELDRSILRQAPWPVCTVGAVPTTARWLDLPLVLTRDEGEARCFEAVCRHRAGPVVPDGAGLRCRYHGWSYDCRGRLVEAPDFGQPRAFAADRVRLPEHPVHAWRQWLWLNCRPQPSWMAMADDWSEALEPDTGAQQRYEIDCNWKVYVENYLEGYHVAALHPGLRAQLADDYVTEVFEDCSVQSAQIDASATGRSGGAHYMYIYPNLMLNILPGRLQLNQVIPLGTQRCEVRFDYQYAAWVSPEQRAADQAQAHQTQLEDVEICEILQRNLMCGSYESGRLSPRWESALMDFQDRYRRSVSTRTGD